MKSNPAVYNTASKVNKDLRSLNNEACVLDIEASGLEPWDSQLICIGVMNVGTKRIITFYNEDEKQMLIDFLEYFHNKQFNETVGYNLAFDVRFLFAKCLKHSLPANGFFSSTMTDLMWIMKNVRKIYNYNRAGKLEEWVEFLFGTRKIPLCDSIANLYKQRKISEIIQYNKWDVEITYRLWERINKVLKNGKM
jgi:uncharacterized protein YprB with RNaseH-like and TPR domain